MKVIHKKRRGSANYGPPCIYIDLVDTITDSWQRQTDIVVGNLDRYSEEYQNPNP